MLSIQEQISKAQQKMKNQNREHAGHSGGLELSEIQNPDTFKPDGYALIEYCHDCNQIVNVIQLHPREAREFLNKVNGVEDEGVGI